MTPRDLKVPVLLSLVFLLGCSSGTQPDSDSDPWDMISLPEVVWAPSIIDMPPYAVKIALDRDLQVSINAEVVGESEISTVLKARYKKYGEYPVIIGADEGLDFEQVWSVVQSCRAAGLWRINYAVYHNKAEPLVSYLDFSAPVREGSTAKGPVILKDPDSKEILRVRILEDGLILQDSGKVVDLSEVDRQLGRLARYSENVTILCIPVDDATHGQVAQFLGRCRKSHLLNVSMMSSEEFEVKTEGSAH